MDALSPWLDTLRVSPVTRRSYVAEVARLANYLDQRNIMLSQLEPAVLRRFWSALGRGQLHRNRIAPAHGSREQSRRIISAFLRWCVAEQRTTPSLLIELKTWATECNSLKEARAPAPAVSEAQPPLAHDLDSAAAALSFWTGASPSELAQLKVDDCDWREGSVRVVARPAATPVMVPIAVAASLARVLSGKDGYVFGDASPATVASIGRRIARSSHTQQRRSSRSLRRGFISLAMKAGWTAEQVRAQVRRPHLPLGAPNPPTRSQLDNLESTAKRLGSSLSPA